MYIDVICNIFRKSQPIISSLNDLLLRNTGPVEQRRHFNVDKTLYRRQKDVVCLCGQGENIRSKHFSPMHPFSIP